MRISAGAILGLLLIVMSGPMLAGQNPPPADTDESRSTPAPALTGVLGINAAVGEEDSSGDMPQIPALLGGSSLSLALGSEAERSNYLRGGLNLGATYDDNTQMTPHNAIGNTTYSIFPNISIDQARSRMRWTLGYAAGLTVNQRLSDRNQGSHDLNFESQFRLSPHVNLRVAEDFSLTSGLFGLGNASGAGAGNGGPSAGLITPLSQQRSSSTVAEVNYHFALKDVVGGSGSFHDVHFSNVSAGALTNTRTAAASAFWLHGLFGRDWAGLSYRFQRLTFEPNGETRVHSILAVNTVKLPNRFTVTGYLGPEYSENQGQIAGGSDTAPVNFSDWSLAGGVDVGWQTERTSVTAGFARQINDGGGVLGVVRSQAVRGTLRQQLLPGWAVSAGASYGRNRAVNVVSSGNATSINGGSVNVALERNLGKSLGLRMGYAHDFQEQIGAANSVFAGTATRNQYFVTIGYQWARPLGR